MIPKMLCHPLDLMMSSIQIMLVLLSRAGESDAKNLEKLMTVTQLVKLIFKARVVAKIT